MNAESRQAIPIVRDLAAPIRSLLDAALTLVRSGIYVARPALMPEPDQYPAVWDAMNRWAHEHAATWSAGELDVLVLSMPSGFTIASLHVPQPDRQRTEAVCGEWSPAHQAAVVP